MYDRMQTFTSNDLNLIHDASMTILSHSGVDFKNHETTGIFRDRGFRTEGTRVFFTEADVLSAVGTAPPEFSVHARNPEQTVRIGQDHFVFLPTGGAPYVSDIHGLLRPAVFDDYEKCCRLVQSSDQLDMGGYIMIQPGDLPGETAHLDMMETYIRLCDKPIFAACSSRQAVRDTIEMAGIVFGSRDPLVERPVMVAVVNPLSPLQFSGEQGAVIVEMARYNQPVVISNMVLAGATGPVSLPSLLALINAEVLAGIVLSQLVSPGTPVIYGTASAPMDMKTMISATGAAEALQISSAAIQMARYYGLPCRTGGSLTDSHLTDAQALAEGVLMLSTVVRNGANFIYHACGQMGAYIAMSFEKWLLDEEICRTVRKMMTPVEISENTLDVDTVMAVGAGGHYLTHPTTFERFRTLSSPRLFNRKEHSKWMAAGGRDAAQAARDMLTARLESYEKPPLDQGMEQALKEYVAYRRGNPVIA